MDFATLLKVVKILSESKDDVTELIQGIEAAQRIYGRFSDAGIQLPDFSTLINMIKK